MRRSSARYTVLHAMTFVNGVFGLLAAQNLSSMQIIYSYTKCTNTKIDRTASFVAGIQVLMTSSHGADLQCSLHGFYLGIGCTLVEESVPVKVANFWFYALRPSYASRLPVCASPSFNTINHYFLVRGLLDGHGL